MAAAWDAHLDPDERARADALLSPEEQERLQRLVRDPAAGMEGLRRDPEFHVAVVRADVLPRLLGWFTPLAGRGVAGWQHDPERSGPLGPASVAVEWAFAGTYEEHRTTPQGERVANTTFNGVRGVGQPVEVHGVTLLGVEGGAFRIRRYIDWAGVYAQLGLSLTWRTPHGAARRRP